MKTPMFFLIAVIATSCEVIVVEPVVDSRNRLTGRYGMEEYSATYNSVWNYTVHVSKAGYDDIIIDNFYDAGLSVRAQVDGNIITIPWQLQNGYEIEGAGIFYGDRIEMNYKVTDRYDYGTDFCNSTAWVQ